MTDVLKKYRDLCSKNSWAEDKDQLAAISALNNLEQDLSVNKSFFARFKKKVSKGGSVYLYGGVGRGKTFVMDLFFQNTSVAEKKRYHFHEFMIHIHNRLHEKRQNKTDQGTGALLKSIGEEIAAETRLLCFDEMFVDDVADAMLLGRLFTVFFEAGMVIVFTSNIRPDDLYLNGLQRERFLPFITLLKDRGHVIHFDGHQDYRAGRLREHKRYTYPLSEELHIEMMDLFEEFADGKVPVRTDIEVKGRNLSFPRTVNGVLLTGFDAVCGIPLGAEDYLSLCDHFSTFIIQNLPQMDDLQRNEVKRFITLVDTLYEKKKLVFFTAEQPIEYLYTGKHYKQEFERIQSRILEMQSPAYP